MPPASYTPAVVRPQDFQSVAKIILSGNISSAAAIAAAILSNKPQPGALIRQLTDTEDLRGFSVEPTAVSRLASGP